MRLHPVQPSAPIVRAIERGTVLDCIAQTRKAQSCSDQGGIFQHGAVETCLIKGSILQFQSLSPGAQHVTAA